MKSVWIIDGAYLFRAPARLDYVRLKECLERLNGARFYESYYLTSTSDDQQNTFHTFLKSAPPRGPKMRLQLYPLKGMGCACPDCGHEFERRVQKGVDVGIATLILKLAFQGQYDRLWLCAGDGDFEDAIAYVKSELHKEIFLCGFEKSMSADLQSYADRVVWLDDHKGEIERR